MINTPRVTGTVRGLCSECGRSYQINARGNMNPHPEPTDLSGMSIRLKVGNCRGSGRKPERLV